MDQKEQMQLLDELMSTIQIMDELYRYHPENPTQVDVVSEFKALAERKVEIEDQTGSISMQVRGVD
jgi:hypothetical protein